MLWGCLESWLTGVGHCSLCFSLFTISFISTIWGELEELLMAWIRF